MDNNININELNNTDEAVYRKVLDNCTHIAAETNTVPHEAFENYRVKRGLREMDGTGVMAGVTKVGNVHGYVVYEGEKRADEG